VDLGDPLCELEGIRDGGGQEDVMDFIGEKDDCLFPYNTSLCSLLILRAEKSWGTFVAHVMDLIEDYPADFSHDLGTAVQHMP
jgi:hypothetical protein